MTDTVTRGDPVEVVVNFYDPDGNLVTPASATLRISYSVAGIKTVASLSMSSVTDGWEATWDSSPADTGLAFWFAQANTKEGVEGTLVIEANSANPQG